VDQQQSSDTVAWFSELLHETPTTARFTTSD
jgi:hypothetical protein